MSLTVTADTCKMCLDFRINAKYNCYFFWQYVYIFSSAPVKDIPQSLLFDYLDFNVQNPYLVKVK